MSRISLEKRVEMLESQVAQLQDEIRTAKVSPSKNWRKTIGAFTDDEGMRELLQDALRLREADRRKARKPVNVH